MGVFVIHPCLPFCWNSYKQQGPFAPPALPGFIAIADPSATLSPSAHFPGSPVIGPTLLQRFRAGARRASPVAWHVLVIVPSLPPRRSEITASVRFRLSILPSPYSCRLGLRSFSFSRPHPRSFSLQPDNSHVSHGDRSSIGFRNSVSLLPAIQATGPLTFAPAGLSPAEHASLRWTHNCTCGFPACSFHKDLVAPGDREGIKSNRRTSSYSP